MPWEKATESDIAEVSKQLGRPARDVAGIGARCVCGNPVVVVTKPRLSDGTPFPTLYYLSHPAATAAVSTLEANGLMSTLQQRLSDDPQFAAAYAAAHVSYVTEREELARELGLDPIDEISGISAGGMSTRVKCLHALVGHALSVGPGVNLVGDLALEECSWTNKVCACAY